MNANRLVQVPEVPGNDLEGVATSKACEKRAHPILLSKELN